MQLISAPPISGHVTIETQPNIALRFTPLPQGVVSAPSGRLLQKAADLTATIQVRHGQISRGGAHQLVLRAKAPKKSATIPHSY